MDALPTDSMSWPTDSLSLSTESLSPGEHDNLARKFLESQTGILQPRLPGYEGLPVPAAAAGTSAAGTLNIALTTAGFFFDGRVFHGDKGLGTASWLRGVSPDSLRTLKPELADSKRVHYLDVLLVEGYLRQPFYFTYDDHELLMDVVRDFFGAVAPNVGNLRAHWTHLMRHLLNQYNEDGKAVEVYPVRLEGGLLGKRNATNASTGSSYHDREWKLDDPNEYKLYSPEYDANLFENWGNPEIARLLHKPESIHIHFYAHKSFGYGWDADRYHYEIENLGFESPLRLMTGFCKINRLSSGTGFYHKHGGWLGLDLQMMDDGTSRWQPRELPNPGQTANGLIMPYQPVKKHHPDAVHGLWYYTAFSIVKRKTIKHYVINFNHDELNTAVYDRFFASIGGKDTMKGGIMQVRDHLSKCMDAAYVMNERARQQRRG